MPPVESCMSSGMPPCVCDQRRRRGRVGARAQVEQPLEPARWSSARQTEIRAEVVLKSAELDGLDAEMAARLSAALGGPLCITLQAERLLSRNRSWPLTSDERSELVRTMSDRAPQEWYPPFPNPVLAEGALDRLLGRAHQLVLQGHSYSPLQRPDRALSQALRRRLPIQGPPESGERRRPGVTFGLM